MGLKSIKLMIFRYIPKHLSPKFYKLINNELEINFNDYKYVEKKNDPNKLKLWNYPAFERIKIKDFLKNILLNYDKIETNDQDIVKLKTLDFIQINGIFIKYLPIHFQYPYSFCCMFEVKEEIIKSLNEQAKNPELFRKEVLEKLLEANKEIKTYTNKIFLNSEYRPIIWLINGDEDENKKSLVKLQLIGIKNKIKSIYNKTIKIERGFPDCSYILYNETIDIGYLPDIILVSVITHQVERGCRENIQNLIDDLKESKEQEGVLKGKLPKDIKSLKNGLDLLYDYSRKIHEINLKLFDEQKKLIRSTGLVKRIKQKWGLIGKATSFLDVVCSDSIIVIDNELESILNVTRRKIQHTKETIEIITKKLNDNRNRRIQSVLMLIQILSSLYIIFRIIESLILISDNSVKFWALFWYSIIFIIIMILLPTIIYLIIYMKKGKSISNNDD